MTLAAEIETATRAAGHQIGVGRALRTQGAAACLISEFDIAAEHLKGSHETLLRAGDLLGAEEANAWLGSPEVRRGDFESGTSRLLGSVAVFQDHRDKRREVLTLHMLGNAYFYLHQ